MPIVGAVVGPGDLEIRASDLLDQASDRRAVEPHVEGIPIRRAIFLTKILEDIHGNSRSALPKPIAELSTATTVCQKVFSRDPFRT